MAQSPESDDLFASLAERENALPSAGCNRQIRKTCTGDLKACHALNVRARCVISLALLVVVGGGLLLLARKDLSDFTSAALWGALGWAAIQSLVLFFGLARQRSGSTRVRLALALLVPVGFISYLTLIRNTTLPLSEFVTHADQTRHALHCGAFSFLVGAAAALGILFLWRRTDPFSPRISGSIAGLVGGLGAATPIGLVCPGNDGWHLWLSHGLSLLLVVGLGAVLGRRWLCP